MDNSEQLTLDLIIEWAGRVVRGEATLEDASANVRAAKASLERNWIQFLDNQIDKVADKAPPFAHALATLNYEAALRLDDPGIKASCAHRLGNVCQAIGQLREAETAYEYQLDLAKHIGDDMLVQNALINLAGIYRRLGDFEHAEIVCREVIYFARETQTIPHELDGLVALGNVLADLGQPNEALQQLDKALELARTTPREKQLGPVLNAIGTCYADLGQFDSALDFHKQALAHFQADNDKKGEAVVLTNLASHHVHLGRYVQAVSLYKQALEISWRQTDLYLEGIILGNLAGVHLLRAEYRQALSLKQRALSIARQTGDRAGEAVQLGNLGYLFRLLGDEQSAVDHYQQSLTLAQEIDIPSTQAAVLSHFGNLFAVKGQVQEALACHLQSLEISQRLGDRVAEIADHTHLGNLFHALGNLSDAEQHYELALALAETIGDQRGRCIVLGNLGNLYRDQGRALAGPERTRLWQHAEHVLHEGARLANELSLVDIEWLFQSNLGDFYATCLQDNNQALLSLLDAAKKLEGVRQELVMPEHRAGFFGRGTEVFLNLLRLALQLGNLELALETAEQIRSRTLLDLLSLGSMQIPHDSPKRELLVHEAQLLSRFQEIKQVQALHLSNAGQILHELDEVYKILAKDMPEYVALRRGKSNSFAEIQFCLRL